ncbi:hypothetical protein A3I99_00210 [Candidatus Kaiserbacteria bacterium RIFCSPLOWO2_02_FULL_45_11b]|uniref:histidine kinase n=1 Tax=Candidatus Kaiserbacteria bacterium RIFCSPLOWO2_12_FULL_45_26 TaxID=1798525 RepID=A0A1F6FGG3_9BACT|nr:MAG: hypothetical protein A2Z56_00535 [Candidatus Kaiserbacteria bacterium RIFCSPHIGHO2_12_45_16]OGG71012.1 MAG: hypothetical protein A2929_01630 [Candidatus Kaiserbacteria bacterium RIFCSPLOWO2_01_FULL_45_25]OGG84209.1 MAG: hypothetical protein A3I99_00210 [Candidatus Kaiserbacteria bacterium RIFCSPLOWO2_02_FULL_45_11b]OGG84938.1 MAG: hypothetical protein A3G90_02620 [Candidatus Kaiserbacteria bacterium RIFCSPLOWO2_12_FULL_45_26]
MNTLLITQLVLGGTIIINILLILFVFTKNIQPLTNKVLLLQMLGILGWTSSIFINLWLKSEFVEYFIFAFAALALVSQLGFVFLYPGAQKQKPWLTQVISFTLGLGTVFIFASFIPGALFSSIEVMPEGYTIVRAGWLSNVYALFVVCYIILAIALLAYKQQVLLGEQLRHQTKYLLYGFIIFFITNLFTNSLLPVVFGINFFNGIGPVFSLILVAFIIHNIYRYKFLEIQLLIQRGLIYLFLLGLVVIVYLGLVTLISHLISPTLQISALTAGAITTIIGIFTVPSIDYHLRRMTHRFFFKGQFDYSQTLFELSQILQETLDVQKITAEATNKLANIFGASYVAIEINDLPNDTSFSHKLSFELTTNNGVVGYLQLGERQSGDDYTKQDRQMLSTIANQVAVAIERSQLYETVREYTHDLEKKVALRTNEIRDLQSYQRQMLDEISHGLQTPIAVISNELSLLTAEQVPHIASFRKTIDSLSQFIRSLLNLSHIEAPGTTLHFTYFNISEAIEEIVEYSEISLSQSGVVFVSSIQNDINIVGDKKKIEEVLLALISNASKYRDPARTQIVSINLKSTPTEAVMTVGDTGHGIDDKHLPHVFKRFYRVRDADYSDIEGTGLGLAIVNAIIQKHHGEITVKSERGVGTVFTITLPINYHKTKEIEQANVSDKSVF